MYGRVQGRNLPDARVRVGPVSSSPQNRLLESRLPRKGIALLLQIGTHGFEACSSPGQRRSAALLQKYSGSPLRGLLECGLGPARVWAWGLLECGPSSSKSTRGPLCRACSSVCSAPPSSSKNARAKISAAAPPMLFLVFLLLRSSSSGSGVTVLKISAAPPPFFSNTLS